MIATASLPDLLGSSSHHAASDDRLKDEDNLVFLQGQPADVRAAWLGPGRACAILREVDRYIEAARLDRDHGRLERLREAWHTLCVEGRLLPGAAASVLRGAKEVWLSSPDTVVVGAASFDAYLEAVVEHSRPGVELRTMWEHDRMLLRVSGSMFRLFPYVEPRHLQEIAAFGALDGLFNNLRDIQEDAEAELCLFPREALDRFGVRRGHIFTGRAVGTAAWRSLMTFWLDEYLPQVRARARAFIEATDLHPSLVALRASCLHRYARVERVLRGLDFDYRAFPKAHEAELRRELAERALGAKEITT